jgi:hypothetical protein
MTHALRNTPSNGSGPTRVDLAFFAVCAVFLYLHLFILPATPIFYEADHLYIAQDAWRMFLGQEIYKDFFQLMFPGTQVCYLVLFKIFGTRYWTINLMILLQGMASTVVTLAISRTIFSNTWYSYLPSALFLFFGFRWFGLDGSHRMFSPVFAMLAVLILLPARTMPRVIGAGALCALAGFFTQQRGILSVGAIAVYLLVVGLSEKRCWKDLLVQEFALATSFAGLLTALVLPFVLSTGPRTFIDYTFLYVSRYVQDPSANYKAYLIDAAKIWSQGLTFSTVMLFYLALIPLIYLVVFVYLGLKKNSEGVRSKRSVLLIALMGSFLTLGTFAPSPSRYFQIAAPALILFVWMLCLVSKGSLAIAKWTLIGLMSFGLILSARMQTRWLPEVLVTGTGNIAFLSPVTIERYRWLAQHSNDNDAVFEVYQSAVNFPLLLQNPTRVTFLLNTAYTPEWMVLQSIDSLENTKARFVIWDANWTAELETIEPGDHLGPLYDYLQRQYFIRKTFSPYDNRKMQLWERRNQ